MYYGGERSVNNDWPHNLGVHFLPYFHHSRVPSYLTFPGRKYPFEYNQNVVLCVDHEAERHQALFLSQEDLLTCMSVKCRTDLAFDQGPAREEALEAFVYLNLSSS